MSPFPGHSPLLTGSEHDMPAALCVAGTGGVANPPWGCLSRSRPVFGLTTVNKLQWPWGAVCGAETQDLSSTAGAA